MPINDIFQIPLLGKNYYLLHMLRLIVSYGDNKDLCLRLRARGKRPRRIKKRVKNTGERIIFIQTDRLPRTLGILFSVYLVMVVVVVVLVVE